ncbi:MAG: PD-(D/E)XK nuclease family protein [Clostridium sp.]|nr:PD-(D/E)XK nuclease family protein [Clostridium sp.]
MLKIVTARAGHGKTEFAHKAILQALKKNNGGVWLLVPEQYAYISERDLIDRIGEHMADRVHVKSFTGLAHSLLRLSAEKFRPLSGGDRSVCMSLALEGLQNELELYSGDAAHGGIVRELLSLTAELRQSGADDKKILAATNKLPQGSYLRKKLEELRLIVGTYDALCGASFLDEETLLDRLCLQLPQTKPFENELVVFNAFHGLTGQETRVLGHILRQAREVVFMLCADSHLPPDDPAGAFAHTRATATELRRLASSLGVECVCGTVENFGEELIPAYSAPAAALAHLEQNLFARDPKPYMEAAPQISLHASPSLQEECVWAALQIKRLVRTKKLRCREIAVIARDSAQYEAPLRAALNACGLPLFPDSRQPAANQPLMLLVRAALDICARGLKSSSVLQYLKTGLAGLDAHEVSLLENYAYIWRLEGNAWARSFTLRPDGLTTQPDAEAEGRLATLEELRRRAVEPLLRLRESTGEALTGEECAGLLWRLLCDCGAAEALQSTVAELERQGESALAQEQAQVWDCLVELLERFALLIENPCPISRLRELFLLMLEAESLGSIPQGIDEPAIGSAKRMRFCQSPRAVLVLGCNAGVFPQEDEGGGLLTPAEREQLLRLELPLSPCGEEKQAQERFFVYHALSAAREWLFLSWHTQGANGSELPPSGFVEEIRDMFPMGLGAGSDGLLFAESPAAAFGELAKRRREPDSGSSAIMAALAEREEWSGRLAALERTVRRKPFALSAKAANDLFGKSLRFSASKAESYAHCPFGYFCRYGIKAKPRKQVKIDAMSRGTLLHFVLERLFTDIGRERLLTMQKEECLDAVRRLVEQYRGTELNGLENTSRLAALLERNAKTLCEVLWRLLEELRQSEFVPKGFEMRLGGEGLPPYVLKMPGGGTISFTGVIDRVDEARLDGESYIRVVDYKSQGKTLKLEDVLGGLQVQLLIYLFALQKARPDAKPAAILYQPVTVKAGGGRGDEETSAMPSGLFLDDMRVLRAMERELARRYIPIGLTAKGTLRKSEALKTLEDFSELKKSVDSLLTELGSQIVRGEIPALPAKDTSLCAYCEYHAVCLHEDSDAVRTVGDVK